MRWCSVSLCSKFFSYCNLENRFLFNPLGVAIHKVHDKPEPPYVFEEVKGHLSSSSGYAKMKVEFSDRILALFRRLRRALNLEMRFQARLYYEPYLTTTCKAPWLRW